MYQRFAQNCKIRKSNWIQPTTPVEAGARALNEGGASRRPRPRRVERTTDHHMEAAAAEMPGPVSARRRIGCFASRNATRAKSLSAAFRWGPRRIRDRPPRLLDRLRPLGWERNICHPNGLAFGR